AKGYAAKIGRVFQMIDDVLDVTADEAELGKPVGSDEENLKTTYVSMFGIEKTLQMAEELTNEAINDLKVFGDEAETLKELAILLLHRKK
ncbi:MAG: polyprenyl synthetase family protein, partial [Clostridia bacterium]|nr:polyprenyl synthetase family protein [Clostridia bacterium]